MTFSCTTALKDRFHKNEEYLQKIEDVLIKAPFSYEQHDTKGRIYTKAKSTLRNFLWVSKVIYIIINNTAVQ